MSEEERTKIINFIQDFGCVRLYQLQKLFNKPNYDFKNILSNGLVHKKDDIFIHNTAKHIDYKMLYALHVLSEYKGRYISYLKRMPPVYLSFTIKEGTSYNVIVTDKSNEIGILKSLKNNSLNFPEADRYYILFEDTSWLNKIDCPLPYAYVIYPSMDIKNQMEVVIYEYE